MTQIQERNNKLVTSNFILFYDFVSIMLAIIIMAIPKSVVINQAMFGAGFPSSPQSDLKVLSPTAAV
jgi:hypothetical protein